MLIISQYYFDLCMFFDEFIMWSWTSLSHSDTFENVIRHYLVVRRDSVLPDIFSDPLNCGGGNKNVYQFEIKRVRLASRKM